jgi:hypothetical protein
MGRRSVADGNIDVTATHAIIACIAVVRRVR